MPATTINSSLPFDPYTTPYGAAESIYPDFSPNPLFDSYDDLATDFNSDSTGSPISPISPVLSSSSPFGASDDWVNWNKVDQASQQLPQAETFDRAIFASDQARALSLSPAINPMDLTMSPTNMTFLPEDLSSVPMFQAPPALVQPPVLYSSPQATPMVDIKVVPATTPADIQRRMSRRGLKRKSSTSASEDEVPSPPPPARRHSAGATTTTIKKENKEDTQGPKKTAHNMIEKRYRTNLNDKIAQLRDSVPSLRLVAQRLDMAEEDGEARDVDDLTPVPKLNKATILSKATEYIAQLESRNRGLEAENNLLRGRMEGLEMLMMNRGTGNIWN